MPLTKFQADLDYFNDSDERVAKAYDDDARLLASENYSLKIEIRQPGYIRAQVSKNKNTTKIEWAHDSEKEKKFISPLSKMKKGSDYQLHFGRPGGVLPLLEV